MIGVAHGSNGTWAIWYMGDMVAWKYGTRNIWYVGDMVHARYGT